MRRQDRALLAMPGLCEAPARERARHPESMEKAMNAIVPYDFAGQAVRMENRNGEPWFVAADVCAILGIEKHRDAVSRLDADETGSVIVDTLGGRQSVAAINESGLYRLVLRSRKESARRFGKWVTSEVLPSIRRTGTYGTPAPALDLNDPATLHRLLLNHTGKLLATEERIAELEPQAAALSQLTQADGSMPVTHAAKVMGVRPGKLFDWLQANGWLYRGADGLLGYQEKINAGLLEHKVERIDRGPTRPAKLVGRALLTPKGIAKLTQLRAGRD